MLTNISIENFKSLEEINLKLTTINLFIGPNRSGKSSVLQAIGLLKQSTKDQIVWNGDVVNMGEFEHVVTKQHQTKRIVIKFEGETFASGELETLLKIHRIKFALLVDFGSRGINKIDYDIQTSKRRFQGSAKRSSMGDEKIDPLEIQGTSFSFRTANYIHNPIEVSGSSSSGKRDEDNYYEIHETLRELLHVFENQINSCAFVPTTRGFDTLDYTLIGTIPTTIPTGAGLTNQARAAASSMAYERGSEKKISKLIKRVFPDVEISHLLRPEKVEITSEDKYGSYNVVNEGFGLNQLIFLFLQLVLAKPKFTVFIEEPEIALHPAAQESVCAVLVDEAIKGQKQLIVTTHSEHVLLGFLEAVMDKRLHPNQLNVYYFERENGVTRITSLPVNERGELQGGLKGFFEVDIKHMEKFLQGVKRKK